MPIYEYQCETCQHAFDVLQKMSDEPVTLCPDCGESTVIRLVSAAGFQLKGTGWYETDFKNKPKPPESKKAEEKPKTKQAVKTTSGGDKA
jgi:putative FmdB family regulatory protein